MYNDINKINIKFLYLDYANIDKRIKTMTAKWSF